MNTRVDEKSVLVKHYLHMNEKNISDLNLIEVGKRIKTLRGKMQQIDFARQFGLEQQDISKIETAKIKPSLDLLLKISVKYNKSIEWILTGEDISISSQKQNSVNEMQADYGDSLVSKIAGILNSKSILRTALASDIEALHYALICEEKVNSANIRINDLEKRLKILEEKLLLSKSAS